MTAGLLCEAQTVYNFIKCEHFEEDIFEKKPYMAWGDMIVRRRCFSKLRLFSEVRKLSLNEDLLVGFNFTRHLQDIYGFDPK